MSVINLADYTAKRNRILYHAVDPAGAVEERELDTFPPTTEARLRHVLKDPNLTADGKVLLCLAVLGELPAGVVPTVSVRELHRGELSEEECDSLGVSYSM